ncbi:MAG: metallophosphoesterase, partial [Eubacteriales bacterium]
MQISRPRLTVADPSFTTGWESRHPGIHARVAVVADLHDRPCRAVLAALRREAPDMILIAGDLTESLIPGPEEGLTRPGLALLPEAVGIAPTFYAYGNHETGAGHIKLSRTDPLPTEPLTVHPYWREKIRQSGAVLLDDDWTVFHGMVIGGLNSGLLNPGRVPVYGWLEDFCRVKGYRILVCHQPEYYDRY